MTDILDDHESIIDEFTYGEGLALALIVGIIFFSARYFFDSGTSRAILVTSSSILASIKIFWPLRSKLWYLITMTTVVVIHIAAIIYMPLSGDDYAGIRLAPILMIDILIVLAVVSLVAKCKAEFDRWKRSPSNGVSK